MNNFGIDFQFIDLPLYGWISAGIASFLILLVFSWQLKNLLPSRAMVALAFALLFMMPYIVKTTRLPLEPVVLMLVDQSMSMNIGNRSQQAQHAIKYLQDKMAQQEVQIDRYDIAVHEQNNTRISKEILDILKQYDSGRIAAIFLITDGQANDASSTVWPNNGPPLHVMLTGQLGEQQASIEVASLPDYAIIGDKIAIKLRANWKGKADAQSTLLSISNENRHWQQKIQWNEWVNVQLPFDHQGRNRFIFTLQQTKPSILPATQTAVVDIPAIASRINILWRDQPTTLPGWLSAFKKDSLVRITHQIKSKFSDYHIAILNQPLSQEFSEKEQQQFATYLQNGGSAVVLQSGLPKDYIGPELDNLLPLSWLNSSPEQGEMVWTDAANLHPVTANLTSFPLDIASHSTAIEKSDHSAVTLVSDQNSHGILSLSKPAGGRLAIITEPDLLNAQPTLAKNILLWLLNQAEFSDHIITLNEKDDQLYVEYIATGNNADKLYVTRPDLTTFDLPFTSQNANLYAADFHLDAPGLYRVSDGRNEAVHVHGNLMVPEWQMATATSGKLASLVQKTGGRIIWLNQMPEPELRWVTTRQQGGKNWLPLREPRATVSTETSTFPLLPKFLVFLLICSAIAYAWWCETR